MRRLRAAVLAAVTVGTTMATIASTRPAAAAVIPQTCFENVVWGFSPALTMANQSGTVTFSWTITCVVPTTTPPPPLPTYSSAGTESFSYSGNCTLATFAGGQSGFLLGGTLAEIQNDQAYLLVPADPCNDAGPTPSTGVQLPA